MALTGQTFYGINIAWGLGSGSMSATNCTGIFQSVEHDNKIDIWEGRDQRGNVVAWGGYNPTETCVIEYFVSDASAASGSASPTFGTNVCQQAAKITIGAGFPVSGTSWIIDDVLIRATNTDAMKITLKGTRYPGIA